jgi:ubiquinone/menaquinone biosynthesis C-methylase UbiE
MLAHAQQRLAQTGNVTFGLMEGGRIPLPDAGVDAAFANMMLHHCPDPAEAIGEMVRILKPGGRLVITDMDAHTHEWMRTEMADEWLGFPRPDVAEWLRAAGLVNVYVESTRLSCCAKPDETPGEGAEISVFVAVGTQRVRGAREAVQASYGAAATQGRACCTPGERTDLPAADPRFVSDIALTSGGCSCGCGGSAVEVLPATQHGYTTGELAAAPQEAATFSLGCGNPGAIAALQPGEVVVDIGSGGGLDAFLASGRVGPEGRVIGVDMTPPMLARARAAAARAGLTNVVFRQGHADALPVADGEASVVMSNCVINLCEDKGRVFEEAYRVLQPGGRLAVSDVVAAGALPMALMADPEMWAGCVHGALPEAEYLALVRAAGFTDVRTQRSPEGGQVGGVSVYSLAVAAHK